MPISGYIGAGAQDALGEVLDRRMREHLRRQQEQQHADDIALRRETIDLSRRQQESVEQQRRDVLQRQQQQDAIAAAGRTHATTAPGDTTEAVAAQIEKDPALAHLVQRSQRPIIDARPIAGTAPLDTSGPQSLPVVSLAPTMAQAKQRDLEQQRSRIGERLGGATNEAARRSIGAEAFGAGLDSVPSALLGQTGEEKTAQELADERRAEERWQRQNAITSGQADARQARSDANIRARAEEGREHRPATSAQTTLAGYASRLEQAEPTLTKVEKAIVGMNPMLFEAQIWADRPSLQSAEIQQYMQASRNLINAVLRRESGAVISPSEFAEARQQYLPVPGDQSDTLELKKQNRALNAAMYKRGAGPAYQSVEEALGTLDEDVAFEFVNGELVEVKKKK